MNKEQQMVQEFMKTFGQECPETPTAPSLSMAIFRSRLHSEENQETHAAMVDKNLEEIADGLADLLYVVYGTAVACGIDIEEIFAEVHRSNMSKMWTTRDVANYLFAYRQHDYSVKCIDTDRHVVKRKDGKIIKSPSWTPPNLKPLLHKQIT